MRHAAMHPTTRARVDSQAEFGRALAAYVEANQMLGDGEVTGTYVQRRRHTLDVALLELANAARAEGAASRKGEKS